MSGHDAGKLYAMKVLKKATIVQKAKTAEHTRTERQVLEHIRQSPFLVTLHYAFQTDTKLHLILGQDHYFHILSCLFIWKNYNHLNLNDIKKLNFICYRLCEWWGAFHTFSAEGPI